MFVRAAAQRDLSDSACNTDDALLATMCCDTCSKSPDCNLPMDSATATGPFARTAALKARMNPLRKELDGLDCSLVKRICQRGPRTSPKIESETFSNMVFKMMRASLSVVFLPTSFWNTPRIWQARHQEKEGRKKKLRKGGNERSSIPALCCQHVRFYQGWVRIITWVKLSAFTTSSGIL